MGYPSESLGDARASLEAQVPPVALKFRERNLPATRATLGDCVALQHVSHRRASWQRRRQAEQIPTDPRSHEFLAVFSHEMRSSLGAIRNAAHLLGLQNTETPLAEKARLLIERQVGRLAQLAEDLIDSARIGSEAQQLRCERIDLRLVLQNSLETVDSNIVANGQRLATILPHAPVWIHADPAKLEQVFVNLLVNATKYTDRGGDLSLGVRLADRQVVVRICDSGIGIAAEALPRVFNLFMQVDASARRAAAGLGIGLALVRSLVELHGGSVTASSAGLGHGSQFEVRLPAL